MLGIEGHGIMSYMIRLSQGAMHQGFGGYGLDERLGEYGERRGTAYGGETIRRVLHTLKVDQWEDLPGTPCRIERDDREMIVAIGHFIEDRWFNPRQLAEEMRLCGGGS